MQQNVSKQLLCTSYYLSLSLWLLSTFHCPSQCPSSQVQGRHARVNYHYPDFFTRRSVIFMFSCLSSICFGHLNMFACPVYTFVFLLRSARPHCIPIYGTNYIFQILVLCSVTYKNIFVQFLCLHVFNWP